MELIIEEHGDGIEKEFSSLIKMRIPSYELIWKNYIGHDGSGKMLKSNLPKGKESKRKSFAELHYTCLESLVSLNVIIGNINKYSYSTIKDLIFQNNDIISFHAHVGRIRDCIKKIGKLFKDESLSLRFDEYWNERCAVLHNRKLPFAIVDGIYLVLKKSELIEERNDDGEFMTWNDYEQEDFTFLNDYLNESFENTLNILNSTLANINDSLKKEFIGFKFINT